MKRINYFLSALLVLSCLSKGFSQSEPLYSQYMFNPSVLNPAYAGYHDMASATLSNRYQWVGISPYFTGGAPTTHALNAHSSLPVDKMGMGITFTTDFFGIINETYGALAYSYKLEFGDNKLSMGAQAGFSSYVVDLTSSLINKRDNEDPVFPDERLTQTLPSFGFGLMFTNPNYFVGVSVPKFRNQTVGEKDGVNIGFDFDRHTYLTAGYVMDFKDVFKLKPSFLLTLNPDGTMSTDINGSLLIREKLWTGVSLRFGKGALDFENNTAGPNAFVLMGQLQLNDLLRGGFAWDAPLNEDLLFATGGTFEIFVNASFAVFGSQAVQTIYY